MSGIKTMYRLGIVFIPKRNARSPLEGWFRQS